MKSKPVFDTIYGKPLSVTSILSLPLCMLVFLVGGGVRHSFVGLKLPSHAEGVHMMHVMERYCTFISVYCSLGLKS